MFPYNSIKKVFLLLAISLHAFSAGDYIDADLGVTLDYSRFSIDGGVHLDINLMVPQAQFTYKNGESGLAASVVFQTALLQDDIVPYPPDQWQRIYRAKDEASISQLGYVPDISKFYVEAGEYMLQVDILDVNSNRRQRITKPVSLELYPETELSLSDITIASKIAKSAAENEFTKYGYDIIPNAERTFTLTAPMMYYFFEAYGLTTDGNYEVKTQVLSIGGDLVKELPERNKKATGKSVVEWGGFNTAGLKSGIYKLTITVLDEGNGSRITKQKTFYILRPKEVAQKQSTGGEYESLSETQLNDIYELVKIVMNQQEKNMFEKSDIVGKRKILTTFWSRKDPIPETAANEYKIDFYKRVQLANREFTLERNEGWRTERGRILIQYGRPDNIERAPSTLDQKPWESWTYYDIEGGIDFIFIDRTGYGNYELVHSTARDEIRDEAWQRFLD